METIELKGIEEWERFKDDNKGSEIVILKKSPLSTVSFVGEKFFDMWCGRLKEGSDIVCVKVNVIDAKSLSGAMTDEFGVKHESPQIIWVDSEGAVKWSGHHHQITIENLNKHLKAE